MFRDYQIFLILVFYFRFETLFKDNDYDVFFLTSADYDWIIIFILKKLIFF
jgi:hypothetical protein